jgi:hypothetical protein
MMKIHLLKVEPKDAVHAKDFILAGRLRTFGYATPGVTIFSYGAACSVPTYKHAVSHVGASSCSRRRRRRHHISPLETLFLNLLLSSSNGLCRLGVDKPASLLVVLERSRLGRADTEALAVVGTAVATAVGIVHASSGDELLSVAVPDGSSTGVVGLDKC